MGGGQSLFSGRRRVTNSPRWEGGGLGKKGPGAAANGLNSSHYNGSPALSTRIFRVGARSSAHTDPNASYLLTPSAGDPKGGRGPSGDPRRGGAAGGVPPRDRQ